MPDLGKYAVWVLSAYGVSLTLLAALVLISIAQARRTRAQLEQMEAGRGTPNRDVQAAGEELPLREGENG